MDRPMRLYRVLEAYSIDRVYLHNLIYMLEMIEGAEIGYRGCRWRIVSTGVFCDEIERDLEELKRRGLIIVDGWRILTKHNPVKPVLKVDAMRVLYEAVNHYIISLSMSSYREQCGGSLGGT